MPSMLGNEEVEERAVGGTRGGAHLADKEGGQWRACLSLPALGETEDGSLRGFIVFTTSSFPPFSFLANTLDVLKTIKETMLQKLKFLKI